MVKFNGCKLEVKLSCQTAILHFQSTEVGVTLRASEVKPKLDKFLKEKKEALNEKFSNSAYVGETNALNYKLKIVDSSSKTEKKSKIHMYYGKNSRLLETNPTLIFITFSKEIQVAIENYIEDFFICYNFGTCQGKGYGSFILENNAINEDKIINSLMNYYDLNSIYFINDTKKEEVFEVIENFYTLSKRGINFNRKYKRSSLFCYMHDKGIDNEKAELKQSEIAPAIGMNKRAVYEKTKNPKYVRAILGVGNNLQFKDGNKIKIKTVNSKIERYASPLLFKVINNKIYIIPRKIDNYIFNKEFEFRNKKTGRHINLFTPEKFDLIEFLNYAMEKYNKNKEELFGYHGRNTLRNL